MSYNPYGGKYSKGNSLKHSRPFGSRNGYSTNPNYRPVGKKAVGQRRVLPNGQVIYTYAGQNDTGSNRYGAQQRSLRTQYSQKAVSKPSQQISKKPTNAYTDTGTKNAAGGNQRRTLGSYLESARRGAERAGSAVGDWLRDRGRDISKFGRTAYEAISNSDERRAYEQAEANLRKNPNDRNALKARNAAKKAYDSHLLTQLGRAPGTIASRGRNAVNQAGEFISTTASNAASTAKRGIEAAGKAISNQDEREAYEQAEANFRKNPTSENRRARNAAKKAYDSHLLTQVGRAPGTIASRGRNVAKRAGELATTAARNARDAISNQDELNTYKDALAREKANPTAENRRATRDARDAYNNHILTRASGTARQVTRNVKGTTKNISQYASQRANEATQMISGLPTNIRNRFDGLIKDIKSGKTKSEIDAALIELQNNINLQVNGPAQMPSDDYLDRVAPENKKKKK